VIQKFFALEQRARAGRRASRNENGKRRTRDYCTAMNPEFFVASISEWW
jgi:D-alanyl-D-alanine dipeptidase